MTLVRIYYQRTTTKSKSTWHASTENASTLVKANAKIGARCHSGALTKMALSYSIVTKKWRNALLGLPLVTGKTLIAGRSTMKTTGRTTTPTAVNTGMKMETARTTHTTAGTTIATTGATKMTATSGATMKITAMVK